jgi:hypothetical protein
MDIKPQSLVGAVFARSERSFIVIPQMTEKECHREPATGGRGDPRCH